MSDERRLAIFLPSLEGGGAERAMSVLAGELARAGNPVDLVLACARGIVAVSVGVAGDLARLAEIPRERIEVIFNPVPVQALRARAREEAAHPWSGDSGPPVLLGVGRLARQKDFVLLIRAVALLRSRRPCRLVILGEGEERTRLEALAEEQGVAGEVALPGFAETPYAAMARCAVFVLSSRLEGLAIVLAEALACGAKVVAAVCPSGPREILEGGREKALARLQPAEMARRYLELLAPDRLGTRP